MRHSYVSILTTDEYLDGILVLAFSLKEVRSSYSLLVLLTSNISLSTRGSLAAHDIEYAVVDPIVNPTDIDRRHRWFPTYSKLHVFGLTQYEKIVYLDADMVVLQNVDELFFHPHMSATNAGGLLPENANWTGLNTGLFVAVPSRALLVGMLRRIGRIENLASGGTAETPRFGSDQDFVNAYYPDWMHRIDLHLDHKYNVLHYHLDDYSKHFGYTLQPGPRQISVIHFASYEKPWNLSHDRITALSLENNLTLEKASLLLWTDIRNRMRTFAEGAAVKRVDFH